MSPRQQNAVFSSHDAAHLVNFKCQLWEKKASVTMLPVSEWLTHTVNLSLSDKLRADQHRGQLPPKCQTRMKLRNGSRLPRGAHDVIGRELTEHSVPQRNVFAPRGRHTQLYCTVTQLTCCNACEQELGHLSQSSTSNQQ